MNKKRIKEIFKKIGEKIYGNMETKGSLKNVIYQMKNLYGPNRKKWLGE